MVKTDIILQQSEALSRATSDAMGTFDWDKAMTPDEDDCKNYNIAAKALVEPFFGKWEEFKEASEALDDMGENDPGNWVGFIKTCCNDTDPRWGKLAELICKYGY